MKFHTNIVILAGLVMLSACSGAEKKHEAQAAAPDKDRCGAAAQQEFVGKPLSALNGVKFSTPMRAIPYNSPVTMDFNPQRLNFDGDQQGIISRVHCG